nr:carboxypeptidase-like regulatory domain-containing protein [Ignavibacteriaceae bacterium]
MKKVFPLLIIIPFLLYAGTTGKLVGVVKDAQTNEPLIGANITIEGTDFGAATNAKGEYVILNIPPGRYNVKVSYIGYEGIIYTDVVIVVDQTTQLSVDLKPQSIEVGEVVVTAKASMIQKDLTSSISVISRDKIESLPVSSFTQLLSLQAGVVTSG